MYLLNVAVIKANVETGAETRSLMGSRGGEVEQVVPALQITRETRKRKTNAKETRHFNDYNSKSKRCNAQIPGVENSC